jgi:hypothetical protein
VLNFFSRDLASSIFVKEFKSPGHSMFAQDFISFHGSRDELCVLDSAVVVQVNFREDFIDVIFTENLVVVFLITFFYLISVK